MVVTVQTLEQVLADHQPKISTTSNVRQAAVALVLEPRGSDFEVIFIKRAQHPEDPWSGHMAFPGGRLEESDSSLLHTAIRETSEEIGLDLIAQARLMGTLDDLQASARGRILPLVIRPFVFMLESVPQLVSSEEVEEIVKVPLSFFLSGQGLSTMPYTYQNLELELPCFRYGQYLIWGLTYHMLTGFLEMLGAAFPHYHSL